jgi:hypothetical protein
MMVMATDILIDTERLLLCDFLERIRVYITMKVIPIMANAAKKVKNLRNTIFLKGTPTFDQFTSSGYGAR